MKKKTKFTQKEKNQKTTTLATVSNDPNELMEQQDIADEFFACIMYFEINIIINVIIKIATLVLLLLELSRPINFFKADLGP